MYTPLNPITHVNGHALSYKPGESFWYDSFSVTDQTEMIRSIASLEQRVYNASTTTCSACRGQGYRIYKDRGQIVRESVGCQTCHGLGKIPNGKIP